MRAPAAETQVRVGVRATSNSQGLSNVDSSRLAELYQSATLSPAFILVPRSLTSRVRVRRMYTTGEAHRTTSSTAVGVNRSKSENHLSRSSG